MDSFPKNNFCLFHVTLGKNEQIWDNLIPYETIRDHLTPLGTICTLGLVLAKLFKGMNFVLLKPLVN